MDVLLMTVFRYPSFVPKQTENVAHLRAHDYPWLVKRWRALAKREGWRMREFARADGFPVYVVESPRRPGPRLYVSAGIHGDEPAATEALVDWCTRRARALKKCDLLVFPCLNPWGLQHNDRHDARGRDLNRGYHRRDVPVVAAQKKVLRGRTFDAAIMLHEDFDAHGVYLYEIAGDRPFWGEKLLAAAARHLPVEPRRKIEGRAARAGLIRRSITPETLPEHPEAFCLRFGHTGRSLTFETPSEFSLSARVRAHGAVLDEVLRLLRS
jgi:murein peptide amidase A